MFPLTAHLHQVLFEELGFRGDIENEGMIVDCFFCDKLVRESEVYSRIRKMMGGQKLPETNSAVIEVATQRQWVTRLLANIIQALSIQNRPEDVAAVNELCDALKVAYCLRNCPSGTVFNVRVYWDRDRCDFDLCVGGDAGALRVVLPGQHP